MGIFEAGCGQSHINISRVRPMFVHGENRCGGRYGRWRKRSSNKTVEPFRNGCFTRPLWPRYMTLSMCCDVRVQSATRRPCGSARGVPASIPRPDNKPSMASCGCGATRVGCRRVSMCDWAGVRVSIPLWVEVGSASENGEARKIARFTFDKRLSSADIINLPTPPRHVRCIADHCMKWSCG